MQRHKGTIDLVAIGGTVVGRDFPIELRDPKRRFRFGRQNAAPGAQPGSTGDPAGPLLVRQFRIQPVVVLHV